MIPEDKEVEENIDLLKGKFESIADITYSFGRYDIILYNYDQLEDLTNFIKEKTTIESWTALKTKVSPDFEVHFD